MKILTHTPLQGVLLPDGVYLDVVGKPHPLQIAAENEWKRMRSEVTFCLTCLDS